MMHGGDSTSYVQSRIVRHTDLCIKKTPITVAHWLSATEGLCLYVVSTFTVSAVVDVFSLTGHGSGSAVNSISISSNGYSLSRG